GRGGTNALSAPAGRPGATQSQSSPLQVANTANTRMFRARSPRARPVASAASTRERSPPPRSEDLIQGPVASLRRRQSPALGGDRAALHAVGVVDDHVHLAGLGRVVRDLIPARRAHPP